MINRRKFIAGTSALAIGSTTLASTAWASTSKASSPANPNSNHFQDQDSKNQDSEANSAETSNAGTSNAAATPAPFKKAVKIGMVKLGENVDLLTKFKVLKELGYDGVELNSPGGPDKDEVRKAIEESGLPVHGVVDSIHWQKTLSHSDEAIRAEGLDGLKKALQDAKDYGGTSVLLVPGVVNDDANYEQCWERSIPEIKKALPLAEELQIDILFENVWNNFLTDPDETAKYIDAFESERVGAYYDVGNSVRYANPVVWVRTLGKRIKKLDIKEFDLALAKENGNIWEGFKSKLLEGTTGWYDVIRELKSLGFEGWGTAEIPGGNKERLEEIADRMNQIFSF